MLPIGWIIIGIAAIVMLAVLILCAVFRREDQAKEMLAILKAGELSGREIRDAYERRTGRSMATPSMYLILAHLEDDGLVASRWGEPTQARGGGRPKYFHLTEPGRITQPSST
jgi:DNA-binding PadR family transcriptional regulator